MPCNSFPAHTFDDFRDAVVVVHCQQPELGDSTFTWEVRNRAVLF